MKHLKLFENYKSEEEIHEICKKYKIENYTINNGIVDVDGDVDLSFKKLSKLPLHFGVIDGGFTCSHNKLTSLDGAPNKVNGDFDCRNNQLKSIEGAPNEVNGSFWCSDNQLKSLEGVPIKVNGDFSCNYNQLKSLEGAPKEVNGNFNCYNNELKSFDGLPQVIDRGFECFGNTVYEIYEQIGSVKHLDEFNMLSIIQEIDGVWSIYKFKLDHFMEDIYGKEFDYSKIESYEIIED